MPRRRTLLAALDAMTEDRNAQRSLAATHLRNLARVSEKYGQALDEAATLTTELDTTRLRLNRAKEQVARQQEQIGQLVKRLSEYEDQAKADPVRERGELAEQQRVIDRLTEQLFDALGYEPADRARLTAGEVATR